MNPFNKVFLALVLLPKGLYTRLGINVQHLTSILTTKLIMDDRRPNAMQATRQHQHNNKEISNATLWTMLISLLMGTSFLLAFAVGGDFVMQLTLYFGIFIAMLCMSLVSDFTSVLIDVRDNNIILPKPVNDSTFVVARLLHIFIHICKMVLPMILPGFIYMISDIHIGAGLLLLLIAFFATLFSIFLINAVYIIILRVTTPEKFKNIISYIQIAFAILIYASYQVLPRLTDNTNFSSWDVEHNKWLIAMPPYWFACAINVLLTGGGTPIQLVAAFMAILFPIASIYVVIKFLAPAFNQKLAMISGGEGAASSGKTTYGVEQPQGAVEKVSALLTTSQAEQTGFLFAWKMMARSRDFKVRVYPSIGYFVVILFMFYFRAKNTGDVAESQSVFLNFKPIIAIYLSSIIVIAAVSQMAYSDKFKAAWMFLTPPVHRPGPIISGALKAVIVQFYFLVAVTTLALGLWLAGPSILPNLMLGLCNQLLIVYIIASISFNKLPFSLSIGMAQKGGNFVRGIAVLFISGFIGVIHFLTFRNTVAIAVAFVLSVACLWWMMHRVRKIGWEKIQIEL